MKRVLVFSAALAAFLALSIAAQAHSEEDHAQWQEDWQHRLELALEEHGVLSVALMEERHDWLDRHPCSRELGTWTDAECRPAPVVSSSPSSSASSGNPPSSAGTGMGTNVEQWRGLVSSYFGQYTDEALRVMACESGGNPNAYNPSGASGLFQIMPSWKARFGGDLFDPANNVRIAKILFDDGASRGNRWSHWMCKP